MRRLLKQGIRWSIMGREPMSHAEMECEPMSHAVQSSEESLMSCRATTWTERPRTTQHVHVLQ